MKTTIYTKTKNNQKLIIDIRCDDECKNGNDTFAITGTTLGRACTSRHLDAVKYNDGKYYVHESGGCIHDIILASHPELKILVDLHLSDGHGVPLYAVENGYHHMRNRDVFKDYLRLTDNQVEDFYSIKSTSSQTHKGIFIDKIESMKPIWLEEAKKGKELIQRLINSN